MDNTTTLPAVVTETLAEHAKLAPSSMKMFKKCLASLLPPEKPILEVTSPYATEGTKAHELFAIIAECWLKEGLVNAMIKLESIQGYDHEAKLHISDLIGYINKLRNKIGKENILKTLIEKKVRFSEHIYGTCDFGFIYVKDNKKKIYIIDLKYGKGTPVPAENNEQLLTYALAAIKSEEWDATEAYLCIYQPRNFELNNIAFDLWIADYNILKKASQELKRFEKKALKVLNKEIVNPKECVGDWCKFCKRKAVCKSFAKKASAPGLILLNKAKPLIKTPKPQDLTDEQLSTIITNADSIRTFLKAAETYAAARYFSENPLTGWKLVAGRSTRKWIGDTEKVATTLKNFGISEPFKQSLLGIGEVEKQLKGNGRKENLSSITTLSCAKPKLVPESDTREGISKENAVDMLTDLNSEDIETF